jgi:glycosyltransferase involved in cell wall biosynthesis
VNEADLNKNEPLVSVIMPTKNSSDTIKKSLESIITQTYRNIEIIVVDNYSKDDTPNIARKYTDKVFTLGPERSPQVNFGVKMASGKYIYEVASDFVLEPSLIEEAVYTAESNNYGAILVHNTSDPTVSYWAKVRKFERDMYTSDDLNVAARFIRRDIFLSVGGFDPELVACEDYDLHNRVVQKYSVGRITAKEVHIGEPKSIGEVAQKHYYYGKTIYSFLKKNKWKGIKQTGPLRKAFFKNYKEFLRNPSLTVGFIVYQIVRYFSGMCGIVVCKAQSLLL